eukprot:353200-Chlamydomonas_euryale.AAC.7
MRACWRGEAAHGLVSRPGTAGQARADNSQLRRHRRGAANNSNDVMRLCGCVSQVTFRNPYHYKQDKELFIAAEGVYTGQVGMGCRLACWQ